MTIHPIQQPRDPQERVWNAINDLRREVRQNRQTRANQVQHAYAENISGQSGITNAAANPFILCSVTVNIPTKDHRVLLLPTVTIQMSDATSHAEVVWTASDPAISGNHNFIGLQNISSARLLAPYQIVGVDGSGTLIAGDASFFLSAYSRAGDVPTPGDQTFNLGVYRASGAGSITATNARLWAGVL